MDIIIDSEYLMNRMQNVSEAVQDITCFVFNFEREHRLKLEELKETLDPKIAYQLPPHVRQVKNGYEARISYKRKTYREYDRDLSRLLEKYKALEKRIDEARAADLPAPTDPIANAPLEEMMQRIKEKDFTLGEWLYFFIDRFVVPKSSDPWIKQTRARVKNHLNAITYMRITDLTGLEIHYTLNALTDPRTREYTYMLVKRALQKATDLRMLPYNPALICEVKIEPKEIRDPMEISEQRKLVKYLLTLPDETTYKDILLWLLWTGMRPSESHKFNIEKDIDWKTGLVDIHGTKTRNAVRKCFLPPYFAKKFKGMIGFPFRHDFEKVNDFMAECCKKLKIPKYTLYHLRHTFGTRLYENNVPELIITRTMGHSNTGFTKKHYIAVLLDFLRTQRHKLDSFYDIGVDDSKPKPHKPQRQ